VPRHLLEEDVVVGSCIVTPLIDRELVAWKSLALAGPSSRPCDAATYPTADWTK
jgi:hypothetical protein